MGAKHNTLRVSVCVSVCVCSKNKKQFTLENFQHAFSSRTQRRPNYSTQCCHILVYVDTVFSKIVCSARSCNPYAEEGEGKAEFNDKHLLNGELNCCTGRTREPFSGLEMYISWWIKNQIMFAINTWMKHLNNDVIYMFIPYLHGVMIMQAC